MKHTYIISYDLKGSNGYDELFEAIQSYSGWAHITESTWAVVTEDSHSEIRDHLKSYLPKGSRLFVVRSANVAAWSNTICSNEWLKKNI
jgi:hypothetical protein